MVGLALMRLVTRSILTGTGAIWRESLKFNYTILVRPKQVVRRDAIDFLT